MKQLLLGAALDAATISIIEILAGLFALQAEMYLVASILIACSLLNAYNCAARIKAYKDQKEKAYEIR